MIITDINKFIKCIPTAEGTEWSAIESFIITADNEIQTFLTGSDLYDSISALSETDALKINLYNLISFKAYQSAIPFMDLVHTANGFAVMSNSNQAPASKERVERLLAWCDIMIDRATDLLITVTMQSATALAEWTKFVGFNDLTNCFFITGIDFSGYFKQSDLKRKTFLDYKNDLMYCQENVLAVTFSKEVINELVTQIRTNTLTESNKKVLSQMKQVMGKYANGLRGDELKTQSGSFKMIYEGLKGNTTYESTPEAIVRLPGTNYENKQEDPTYFFGY